MRKCCHEMHSASFSWRVHNRNSGPISCLRIRNATELHMWTFSLIDWDFLLLWRHNGHDSVSNHQPYDCLLNQLFRHRSKKTSKLRVTGLCAGEFPAQMASNAENVSIWWRHHGSTLSETTSGKEIMGRFSRYCHRLCDQGLSLQDSDVTYLMFSLQYLKPSSHKAHADRCLGQWSPPSEGRDWLGHSTKCI